MWNHAACVTGWMDGVRDLYVKCAIYTFHNTSILSLVGREENEIFWLLSSLEMGLTKFESNGLGW